MHYGLNVPSVFNVNHSHATNALPSATHRPQRLSISNARAAGAVPAFVSEQIPPDWRGVTLILYRNKVVCIAVLVSNIALAARRTYLSGTGAFHSLTREPADFLKVSTSQRTCIMFRTPCSYVKHSVVSRTERCGRCVQACAKLAMANRSELFS